MATLIVQWFNAYLTESTARRAPQFPSGQVTPSSSFPFESICITPCLSCVNEYQWKREVRTKKRCGHVYFAFGGGLKTTHFFLKANEIGPCVWVVQGSLACGPALKKPKTQPPPPTTTKKSKGFPFYFFGGSFLFVYIFFFLGGKQEFLCVCVLSLNIFFCPFHECVCVCPSHKSPPPTHTLWWEERRGWRGRSFPLEFCIASLAPTAVRIAHVFVAAPFPLPPFSVFWFSFRRNWSAVHLYIHTQQKIWLFPRLKRCCHHLDITAQFSSVLCDRVVFILLVFLL